MSAMISSILVSASGRLGGGGSRPYPMLAMKSLYSFAYSRSISSIRLARRTEVIGKPTLAHEGPAPGVVCVKFSKLPALVISGVGGVWWDATASHTFGRLSTEAIEN